MKRFPALCLCLILALGLAACGGRNETAPAPEETAVPAADAAPALPAEPEADPAYAAAADCVGRTVQELTTAVGEPKETKYAPSCLVEGAEDGMLYYDGFYVWTVKTDTEELVHEVYLTE